MDELRAWGWGEAWEAALEEVAAPGLVPGRVVAEYRSELRVRTADGERKARSAGSLRHRAAGRGELPAVGDWVLVEGGDGDGMAVIREVLPRRSRFSRKEAGERTEEQVVAANIDRVWIAVALDQPLSLRRIERFLAVAWESGAQPELILTKADLAEDPAGAVRAVEGVAFGVPVRLTSGLTGEGMAALEGSLAPGLTVALLGPSGVGKSTLINRLAGSEILRVGEVWGSDRRGRHTTTHRQLVRLPCGALVVDTPGMRELQLWEGEEGIRDTFGDIEELAAGCRFADCSHQGEPGCAVEAAVAAGELAAGRLASWHKLQREAAYQARRHDARARSAEERRIKSLMRTVKAHPKYRKE